jgi:hypothetical protein
LFHSKLFVMLPLVLLGVIAFVKAYFIKHSVAIGLAAIRAGLTAYMSGGDVADAATRAGASEAAADLLEDALKAFFGSR